MNSLTQLLSAHAIPVSTWGTGAAKTLEHLLREVNEGESSLVEAGGQLVRMIKGVSVRIYCLRDGKRYLLSEDRQIFRDGRVRRREVVGLGEKMKQGEDPVQAASRVFTEELGIQEPVSLRPQGVECRGPIASNSFPGLLTRYETHLFEADMPDSLHQDEYVETQADKTNYYRWVEVAS